MTDFIDYKFPWPYTRKRGENVKKFFFRQSQTENLVAPLQFRAAQRNLNYVVVKARALITQAWTNLCIWFKPADVQD